MLVSYTIQNLTCTNCSSFIRRGIRRFGPSQVKCGFCGSVLNTSLDGWDSFSTFKKIWMTVLEIMYPSFLRGIEFPMRMIMWFFHACFIMMMFSIVFVIPIIIQQPEGLANLAALPVLLLYPVLVIVWFVKMVKESVNYSKTGEAPVWKIVFGNKS